MFIGCGTMNPPQADGDVLATVRDTPVRQQDVERHQKVSEFTLSYRQNSSNTPSQTDILDGLIRQRIVEAICAEKGVSLTDKELMQIEALRDTALSILDLPAQPTNDTQDMVRSLLEYTGMTIEEYADFIYSVTYSTNLRHKLEREYFQGDAQLLESYITQHYDDFDVVIYSAIQ